jgi:hypothetical protein
MVKTAYWQDKDTFKLMPLTKECPYLEVVYDPGTTLLVVISKIQKDQYQMVPKLDDNGDRIPVKRPRENSSPFREQRVTLKTFQEFYITKKEEQEEFLKEFAINFSTFDYKQYLRDIDAEPTPIIEAPEKAPLVDDKGQVVAKKK